MPTYDYECNACGHRFEGKAAMADPPPPCPATYDTTTLGGDGVCGGDTRKKFNRAPSSHFHGGGWAKDGYATAAPPTLTLNQHLDRSSGS